jgi:integrase/recombinase XerC
MLEKQITGFIDYCKLTDFSTKSIESLSASLREFSAFVQSLKIETLPEITYRHLLDFVADFRDPSIHKKKARIWSLRQFFHFLTLHNLVGENIALGLPYPKIEKTVPQFLTVPEFNRLLYHFSKTADSPLGLRNLTIILMLGLLGLRTGSIVALNIEHIDLVAGLAWVKEKGRQQRHIVLPMLLCKVLKPYIAQLEHDKGPLFLSTRKKRISPRTLQDIFRSAADKLGTDKRLHANLFRHTAATHLNKVAGTTITQTVLGHARRHNTLMYAHLNPDKYALYMKKHPFIREVR